MAAKRISGDHLLGLLLGACPLYLGARVFVGQYIGGGSMPWESSGLRELVASLWWTVAFPITLGMGAIYLGARHQAGERRWPGRVAGALGELGVALGIVWLVAAIISLFV